MHLSVEYLFTGAPTDLSLTTHGLLVSISLAVEILIPSFSLVAMGKFACWISGCQFIPGIAILLLGSG